MKRNLHLLSACSFVLLTVLTSCEKYLTPRNEPSPEMAAHSEDQALVSNEVDAVANDANIAMESNATFSGREASVTNTICDATVSYDSSNNQRKITVVYNGASCSGSRVRTGTVQITMPAGTYWKDAGATLTVSYQNLVVKRLSDNKTITLNGTHTFTNVSGGRIYELATRPIVHTIQGQLTLTFDDNSQRSWNVAHKREYAYNNGIVVTITGIYTDGNRTNVAEWGTNRFGKVFYTTITEPLIIRQDCNFRLTAGQVHHEAPAAISSVTFGLDKDGNPASCPGTGKYYAKLTWEGFNGSSHHSIFAY